MALAPGGSSSCTSRRTGSERASAAGSWTSRRSAQPEASSLWTFQVNARARRFYERNGFVAVEFTEGSGNQERQPDVRYEWPAARAG